MHDARAGVGARFYVPLAVLFSLLWASAFDAVKIVQRGLPPLFLMGFRFVIAGGILLLLAAATRQVFPRSRVGWARLAVLGVLNFGLYLGISSVALERVSGGLGAVLASTNPLMLAAVAPFLLQERISRLRLGGMLVAFVSVVIIMAGRIGAHDTPLGMALILVANAFLTAGTVLFRRWQPEEHLTVVNGVQLLAAAVVLLAPSLVLERLDQIRLTTGVVLAFAYLVVAVSLGAMTIWFFMLRTGDAARATSYFFLNPVFGLFLGALLLAEPLRPLDFAGAAGVAVGLYLVQRG
ncbi:MAG: EamA family transporter [Candidatus Dormibacteraeota bacterium]|nr:EamA family transporter [Candidatus Dormibacteraeota bacterium]